MFLSVVLTLQPSRRERQSQTSLELHGLWGILSMAGESLRPRRRARQSDPGTALRPVPNSLFTKISEQEILSLGDAGLDMETETE